MRRTSSTLDRLPHTCSDGRARQLIDPWLAREEATTCMVVYGEVVEYIKSFGDFIARRESLQALLEDVRPYGLSYTVMERYADLRRQLRPPHGPGLMGDIDSIVAATALVNDLTVVTTDTDFDRVPGLSVLRVKVR